MINTLYFIAFLSYCSVVTSQPTLTQPASGSVAPGETAKLSCAISSNPNNIRWLQQKSGQVPRFVHCDGCSRGPGIPDRFTGTRSGNMGYLTITSLQAEDEADYYCFMWYSNMYIFGGGTHLTVTGQPPVPPSVSLFPPSQEEIKSKNKATLACLVDGFHPGVVQVEWKADGSIISSGVETSKPVKQGDKYVASSYLTLSSTDWQSHDTYTCKVTHEGKPIEKVVNRSQCS